MENFFNKVNKVDTNATYHNPYSFLTREVNTTGRSKRLGDFVTTLWLETAGLTVFMSTVALIPTFF